MTTIQKLLDAIDAKYPIHDGVPADEAIRNLGLRIVARDRFIRDAEQRQLAEARVNELGRFAEREIRDAMLRAFYGPEENES